MLLIICTCLRGHLHQNVCCAGQGKQVVRLKGGCPSVFSRVGSEMQALQAAGVPYELVPGVSSALAAPLLAGQAMQTCQGLQAVVSKQLSGCLGPGLSWHCPVALTGGTTMTRCAASCLMPAEG